MKFIIPMMVGSIIGYITNWLAIKMLFRPHEEKKLFGFKLPFTPGLIPKERERISKSIGDTVGNYLLTPQVLINSVTGETVEEELLQWSFRQLNKLKESPSTIKEIINKYGDKNYNKISKAIEKEILVYIYLNLKSEKIQNKILDFFQFKIYEPYKLDILNNILQVSQKNISNIFTQEEVKLEIENFIINNMDNLKDDNRELRQALPEVLIENINSFLEAHEKEIASSIQQVFHGDDLKPRLKSSIANLVEENISKAITMFISAESISEKIYQVIEKYVDNPNTGKDIIFAIKIAIDKILNTEINTFISYIPEIIKDDEKSLLIDIIYESIFNEENQRKVIELIGAKAKSLEPETKGYVLELMSEGINRVLDSNILREILSKSLMNIMEDLSSSPISLFFNRISEERLIELMNILRKILDDLIIVHLPEVISIFNVSKIVEEEINSFDVEFTEKLILDIANKELKAITWLGALLGAIMGLISPLLQMIGT